MRPRIGAAALCAALVGLTGCSAGVGVRADREATPAGGRTAAASMSSPGARARAGRDYLRLMAPTNQAVERGDAAYDAAIASRDPAAIALAMRGFVAIRVEAHSRLLGARFFPADVQPAADRLIAATERQIAAYRAAIRSLEEDAALPASFQYEIFDADTAKTLAATELRAELGLGPPPGDPCGC